MGDDLGPLEAEQVGGLDAFDLHVGLDLCVERELLCICNGQVRQQCPDSADQLDRGR